MTKLVSKTTPIYDSSDLILTDDQFIAPKEILHMYQKMGMVSFKIWSCLISDISNKKYTCDKSQMPLNKLWPVLGRRMSGNKLNLHLQSLQTTLITQEEYLPQVDKFERKSFQALGETTLVTDSQDDVLAVEYQMMQSLLSMLKDSDKEKFTIELNVFSSLKGSEGANSAKNILLFCTPYIFNGITPEVSFVDLKAFMGMSNLYNDKDGNHDVKSFNRAVLKRSIQLLNDNPFVSFNIDKIVPVKSSGRTVGCSFKLSLREKLLPSFKAIDVDPSSPLNPKKIKTILDNYWKERVLNPNVSYDTDVLINILAHFHLVKKYRDLYLTESNHEKSASLATYRIISIATAIYQLWLDGYFDKEDSKIYKYSISVFSNPKMEQIGSLVERYLQTSKISAKNEANEKQINEHVIKSKESLKRLSRAINKYKKGRYHISVSLFKAEGVIEKDARFRMLFAENRKSKPLRGVKGTWITKALAEKPLEPVLSVLSKNTIPYYTDWLTQECIKDSLLTNNSIEELMTTQPNCKRDIAFLRLQTTGEFGLFESKVMGLVEKNK